MPNRHESHVFFDTLDSGRGLGFGTGTGTKNDWSASSSGFQPTAEPTGFQPVVVGDCFRTPFPRPFPGEMRWANFGLPDPRETGTMVVSGRNAPPESIRNECTCQIDRRGPSPAPRLSLRF